LAGSRTGTRFSAVKSTPEEIAYLEDGGFSGLTGEVFSEGFLNGALLALPKMRAKAREGREIGVSIANQDRTEPQGMREIMRGLPARVLGLFTGNSDHSVARRGAATAFIIRVAGAAVAFLSQIILARWMGRYEFGVYVYVWTWLLLIGSLVPLGLCTAAQRFIPEYTTQGDAPRLRGYLFASRWLVMGIATLVGGITIAVLLTFKEHSRQSLCRAAGADVRLPADACTQRRAGRHLAIL
jgi:hypothetical protein